MTEDADAVDVDPLVTRRELLDARLLIGETVVPHVEIAEALIRVGAIGAAAAIADLDDDEPEIGESLVDDVRREAEGDRLRLWPGIHVGDDRIFLRRIEIEGLEHVRSEEHTSELQSRFGIS